MFSSPVPQWVWTHFETLTWTTADKPYAGIGAAIARRLAKQKANLILLARNEKKLQELARELQVDSGRLVYCTADVSRYDQVEDAVRKAVKEVGDIDILVNNAGQSSQMCFRNTAC